MIQQSVLQKLKKQKAKLTIAEEEDKPNPSKVKSPVKRKSNFTNRSSKENNINDEKRTLKKKKDNKRKKSKAWQPWW